MLLLLPSQHIRCTGHFTNDDVPVSCSTTQLLLQSPAHNALQACRPYLTTKLSAYALSVHAHPNIPQTAPIGQEGMRMADWGYAGTNSLSGEWDHMRCVHLECPSGAAGGMLVQHL